MADPDLELEGKGGGGLLALPAFLSFAMFFFPQIGAGGGGGGSSSRSAPDLN